jgi:hypothetical protein
MYFVHPCETLPETRSRLYRAALQFNWSHLEPVVDETRLILAMLRAVCDVESRLCPADSLRIHSENTLTLY